MIFYVKKNIRDLSNNNKYLKNAYQVANNLKVNFLKNISDEKFAKLKYKENTGLKLDLKEPTSYNEKLWWLKLNNRDPLMTICSDKAMVRNYVEERGLEKILTNCYGTYEDAEKIIFEKLPSKVFLKCTHGSGTNIIYDKSKPFNKREFVRKFNKSLKSNYYYQAREWNYKNIKPQIIIEEYLELNSNEGLVDYRFLCFDGKVKLIYADIETTASDGSHSPYAKRNVYTRNFEFIDVKVGREQFNSQLLEKPENLEEMIKYAEILSSPFIHCRVDFYNLEGKIYFGEITFYPGGATQKISPPHWDTKIADWIDLESEKIVRKEE